MILINLENQNVFDPKYIYNLNRSLESVHTHPKRIHINVSWLLPNRDSIGGSSVVGDLRWAGMYGTNVDFVARSHCSMEIILLHDIEVSKHSKHTLFFSCGFKFLFF